MRKLKDKLVNEAIDFYKIDSILDADFEEELDFDDLNASEEDDLDFSDIFGDDGPIEDDLDFSDIFGDDDSIEDDPEGESFGEEDALFDDNEFDEGQSEEDPDKQGMIRTVRGAYLVYKRVTSNNNYEELWVFNTKNIKSQTKIKNDILAGTDIDPVKLMSPDGGQSAMTWNRGNVQFLTLTGLPN
jgi:hypothetical protein